MARKNAITPPRAARPVERLLSPLLRFMQFEASGGILLLVCTVVALAWANSAWGESYHDFWHAQIEVRFGSLISLDKSLAHWVNDALMVIFFFVVGLEIKRELIAGELATFKKAALPMAAAAGGMIVPAGIYAAFNAGEQTIDGWAIPAATDIAFALGVMTLLGSRVPMALKVFLTALAIVDDIGAVAIIAIFYTSDLSWMALGASGVLLAVMIIMNLLHVRAPIPYLVVGILVWMAFLESGVHATIAGVVTAFTIPAKYRIDGAQFVAFARDAIERFDRAGGNAPEVLTNQEREALVQGMEQACEDVQTPLQRIEHDMLPWVSFFIMPVFALANAGVKIGEGVGDAVTGSLGLGVILGLFLGKQIGVTLGAFIAVRAGLASLPARVSWMQIHAASCLAGIGFTMSLFIGNLAFADAAVIDRAKIAILCGSLISAAVGLALLWRATNASAPES